MTNISPFEDLAHLLQAIGQPARLQILLAIGEGETCVCHLEATFGWRQAYLSQHLMALREAGLLEGRREGRYIFYRLSKPEIMEMVELAALLAGVDVSLITTRVDLTGVTCDCPKCSAQKEDHAAK
jgi:DNA-binding transcriptional ArsR family regulator